MRRPYDSVVKGDVSHVEHRRCGPGAERDVNDLRDVIRIAFLPAKQAEELIGIHAPRSIQYPIMNVATNFNDHKEV